MWNLYVLDIQRRFMHQRSSRYISNGLYPVIMTMCALMRCPCVYQCLCICGNILTFCVKLLICCDSLYIIYSSHHYNLLKVAQGMKIRISSEEYLPDSPDSRKKRSSQLFKRRDTPSEKRQGQIPCGHKHK